MPIRHLLAVAASAVVLSSCATDAGQREQGANIFDMSPEAAALTYKGKQAEQAIIASPQRINDAELNAYVRGIVDDVAGDYKDDVRVYLVEAPAFNAMVVPNGAMAVYSGLMLRMDNEAQLANVLGHEFGHFLEQHALEKDMKVDSMVATMILVNGASSGYGITGSGGGGALASFNRKHELEADAVGIRRASAAGYAPEASMELWKNLQRELAQSSNEKKRKRGSSDKANTLDTHPPSAVRIAELQEIAATLPAGKTNGEAYRARIRPFLLRWYAAELLTEDYGSVLALVERKRELGEDLGVLGYVEGLALSLRNAEGDKQAALDAWDRATAHRDVPTELYREKGLLLKTMGRTSEADEAFRLYLSSSPKDADFIRSKMG